LGERGYLLGGEEFGGEGSEEGQGWDGVRGGGG